MTLREALENATRNGSVSIWRTGHDGQRWFSTLDRNAFSKEDVLATDWEIEEKRVALTRSAFYRAVSKVAKEVAARKGLKFYGPTGVTTTFDVDAFEGWGDLTRELGLD